MKMFNLKNRIYYFTLSVLLCVAVVTIIYADYTQITLSYGDPPLQRFVYRWDTGSGTYEKAFASCYSVKNTISNDPDDPDDDYLRYLWVSYASVSIDPSYTTYRSDYELRVTIDIFSREKIQNSAEGQFTVYEVIRQMLDPAPDNLPFPEIEQCESLAVINGVTADVPD